jgi:hypothetical protein
MRTFLSLPVLLLATVATAAATAQSYIAAGTPFITNNTERRMRKDERAHFEKETLCDWSDFTNSIPIGNDGSVTLDYKLIRLPTKPNDVMLCGRLTVDMSDEYYESTATTVGWMGIAISPEEGDMNDSIAIIGLLPTSSTAANNDETEDEVGPRTKNGNVQMYDISRSEWRGVATPMNQKYQTLTDTSITIQEYLYAGVSKPYAVMTFGIPLLNDKQQTDKDDDWQPQLGNEQQQAVSIKEHGLNYLIFKQGITNTNELMTVENDDGGSSIPFNDANSKFTVFTKDFDDDITMVSIIISTLLFSSCIKALRWFSSHQIFVFFRLCSASLLRTLHSHNVTLSHNVTDGTCRAILLFLE